MGTNYYCSIEPPCQTCGRGGEWKHIGKSAAGWCFALRVYPEEGICTLADWIQFWQEKSIQDEYSRSVTPNEMFLVITVRHCDRDPTNVPMGYSSWDEFHRQNSSLFGPHGLVRHKIDGRRCIGHGDGTYDYLVGEFS